MLNLIYVSLTENMDTADRERFEEALAEPVPMKDRARRLALVEAAGGEVGVG